MRRVRKKMDRFARTKNENNRKKNITTERVARTLQE